MTSTIRVRKLGLNGAAYDGPNDHRAYSYTYQPGNLIAHRLGHALSCAAIRQGGDFIDGGLSLLNELEAKGYGVFELAEPGELAIPPAEAQVVGGGEVTDAMVRAAQDAYTKRLRENADPRFGVPSGLYRPGADETRAMLEAALSAQPRPEPMGEAEEVVAVIHRPGWPHPASAVYFTMEHSAYDLPPGTMLYAAPRPPSAPVGVEAIADKIESDRTYWRDEAVMDLRALAQQPAPVTPVGVDGLIHDIDWIARHLNEPDKAARSKHRGVDAIRHVVENLRRKVIALSAQPRQLWQPSDGDTTDEFLMEVYEQCCDAIRPLVDAGRLPPSVVLSVEKMVESFDAQPRPAHGEETWRAEQHLVGYQPHGYRIMAGDELVARVMTESEERDEEVAELIVAAVNACTHPAPDNVALREARMAATYMDSGEVLLAGLNAGWMDRANAALSAQPRTEVCDECGGERFVVGYVDPYDRGDASSPVHSPCPQCADQAAAQPASAPVGVEGLPPDVQEMIREDEAGWALAKLAESHGAVREDDDNDLWWTMRIEQFKALAQQPAAVDGLTASEAVFAFAAMLTCQPKVLPVGATADAAPVAQLVGQFCKAQGLSEPRDDYHTRIKRVAQPQGASHE